MSTKNIFRLALVLLVTLIGLVAFVSLHPKANTDFKMSPAAAKAVIDGSKIIKPGLLRLTPGKHTLTASFTNFTSKTTTFNVPTTGKTTVTVILQATNNAGLSYLSKHPEDQGVREQVGGQDAQKTNQQINKQLPIISQLPYIGPGNSYRIDYGPSPGDTPNQVAVIITYYTDDGKQAALNWITSQGYDPSKLPITYTNAESDDTSTDNPYTN